MKLSLFLPFLILVNAHSDHSGKGSEHEATKPPQLTWAQWHMAQEHSLDEFDAATFFTLHDLSGSRVWSRVDILNIYGLINPVVGDGSGMGAHGSNKEITDAAKDKVVNTILGLIDSNKDGKITFEEWIKFSAGGGELPDLGYGPGHHLDFESEYEEHHWKKYHMNDDPDVLIKHKEDIEHELLHHEHEIEESHSKAPKIREVTKNFLSKINLNNLTPKYTRK
ncbi:hypothetical protein JA1_001247 [Spathaspora sp. JA1]|nr:hypothetical protein JA1_001247 [Spathaspora sp. JA1]